jgi:hypothetical protein
VVKDCELSISPNRGHVELEVKLPFDASTFDFCVCSIHNTCLTSTIKWLYSFFRLWNVDFVCEVALETGSDATNR